MFSIIHTAIKRFLWPRDRVSGSCAPRRDEAATLPTVATSALILGLWLTAGPATWAATFEWDASVGDTTVTDGTGVWQVAVGNWWDGAADQTWSNGNDAVFGSGTNGSGVAGRVMLGSNVAPRSIVFEPPNGGEYTLDLNGFELAPTLDTWGAIEGRSGFGPVTISDAFGSGALVTPGDLFSINLIGGPLTISSRITGAGRIFTAGAGDLTLTNPSNDFSGSLGKQNGGALRVSSIANTGLVSAAGAGSKISFGYNAALIYIGSGDSSDRRFSLFGDSTANLYSDGTGALTLTGPVTNASVGNLAFNVRGSNTGDNEIQGVLNDNGTNAVLSVGKHDGGTWVFSGSNTYSGVTTVHAGTLTVANNQALGAITGDTVVVSGAKLVLHGDGDDLTIAEPLTIGSGSGALRNQSGDNHLTGLVTLSAGTDFRRNAGTLTFGGGMTSANHGVSLNGLFCVTNTPVNLGTGGLTFTSNGNNPNTPSEINVGSNTWGVMRINFGGYVLLGVDQALPPESPLEFGWHLASSSSGTLDLNGHGLTVASLSHTTGFGFGEVGGDQNITGGGVLTVNPSSTNNAYVYNGRFTDAADGTGVTYIVKQGQGTQVLNNISGTPSSHSGDTRIDAGVLQAGGPEGFSLASRVVVSTNGMLRLNGYSIATGSLAGTGIVENAALTVSLFDDDFSDPDVSASTSRLRESNIDDGWFTRGDAEWRVVDGRIQNAATNIGAYPEATPSESALVQMRPNGLGGDTLTLSFDYNVSTGDRLYVHLRGHAGVLVDDDDMIGNIEPCNGAYSNLEGGAGNFTELDAFNLKNGATTFAGGAGDALISVTGSGVYTGVLSISGLAMDGIQTLQDFAYISLAFCKTEDGVPGTTWVDNVSMNADLVALTLGGDNRDATFAGTLRDGEGGDPLGVAKSGSGTQVLSGANLYSGATYVSDGVLKLANGGSLTLDAAQGLAVAEGNGTLEVGDGGRLDVIKDGFVLINDGGTLDVSTGGVVRLATNGFVFADSGGVLALTGGMFLQDLGPVGSIPGALNSGTGLIRVESGSLQMTNGPATLALNQFGPVEISGGDIDMIAQLRVYDEFKVVGDNADITIGWLGGDTAQGSFVFELDSTGVSTVDVLGWCTLGSDITVDGSAYRGGDTNILLLDSAALAATSSVVNVVGFSDDPARQYRASVEQVIGDGKDWVMLRVQQFSGLVFEIK